MPTQKKKLKKGKPDPAPTAVAPVQIKAEPLDIKPLGAFVDDRVELIRQAFSCLKPKEIKCLVPDFLQGKSIESLQEQCLDELLGISTKRLLSIINNTKCPTDTESSSDEDEKTVEHISLDEISSDSDVEIAKPIAKKSRSKDVKSKKGKEPEVKNAKAVNDKPDKNGGKKSEKEMTVLELLELQARARAIRSQLALEPVTKIELDSDQDGANTSDTERASEKPSTGKVKSGETNNTKKSHESPPKEQSKRVRLKRNFRIRQVGDEDLPDEASQSSIPEQRTERKSRSKSKENEQETKPSVDQQTKKEEETKESNSRESSPEVIPVIPSPETLCISSDSEDEKAKKGKPSIFVDNIEELEKQLKEKQTQDTLAKSDHKDEPEEGELTEEDKSPQRSRKESVKSNGANSEKIAVESPKKITSLDQEEELDYEVREVSDSEAETSNPGKNDSTKTETEGVEKEDEDSEESEPESDSTDDDAKNKSSSEADEDHDPDVVEIHDSSDETLLEQKLAEDETEKSWGSRWLESKRVAKVMAASRLGNKVRDKLKKKKQKEQQQQELEKEASKEQSPEPPKEPEIAPNVEEGSVEHYKELVANAGGHSSKDKDNADEVADRTD